MKEKDRVFIRPGHYESQRYDEFRNVRIGTIQSIDSLGEWHSVLFDDGYINSYEEKDLELCFEQAKSSSSESTHQGPTPTDKTSSHKVKCTMGCGSRFKKGYEYYAILGENGVDSMYLNVYNEHGDWDYLPWKGGVWQFELIGPVSVSTSNYLVLDTQAPIIITKPSKRKIKVL